jgi:hypothetical protein
MKRRPAWAALWFSIVLAGTFAQAAADRGGAGQDLDPNLVRKITPGQSACLGDGTGFVRARVRGALNVDLSWKDAQLACSGDARPDGSGLRVSFAGPGPGGRVMRLVFGISSAREGKSGRELPTNLTLLVDGGRIFATRGDDKCTTDQVSQRRLPSAQSVRVWRIEARGFCVIPAQALDGKGSVLISRFDFAGRVEF